MRFSDAIDEFFELLEGNDGDSATLIARLEKALDGLAFSRHFVPASEPKTDDGPPDWPYNDRRKLVAGRFPTFGFYAVTLEPLAVSNPTEYPTALADAVDDLADIAGDLQTVRWYLQNGHHDDAAWHFLFGYRTHWGNHLRELQFYLRNRIEAAPDVN